MQSEPGRRPGVIGRVVTWLRAGYPEGIPTGDYVALLGVLRRRLREEEIQEIVEQLAAQRSLDLTSDRIRELIREFSLQEPHEGDVARVTTLLAEAGYPVEGEAALEDQVAGAEGPADGVAGDEPEPGEGSGGVPGEDEARSVHGAVGADGATAQDGGTTQDGPEAEPGR